MFQKSICRVTREDLSKTGISMLPRAPPDMKMPLAIPRLRGQYIKEVVRH